MEVPTLSNGVIRLDGHTLDDVDAMVAGEDEEHARRFGWFPARSTEETGRAAIERWQRQWCTRDPTRAFAAREAATGRLVGGCEIRLGEDGIAAISYWVFRCYRRRGYATRAVRLASDYAFAELGASLLELHIAATNTASRGVARRAGFEDDPGPARHGPLAADEVLYSRGLVTAPTVHMLCGLTGSGKTVYAKRLEAEGCVRLSVDELIHERHGRYGVDYPAGDYLRLYRAAVAELDRRLVELLEEGRSVVLDYGLWERSNRDRYKRLVEAHGGRWRLIYFKAEPELLRRRLAERNRRADANALTVTDSMLEGFIARFQAPESEGELVLEQGRG